MAGARKRPAQATKPNQAQTEINMPDEPDKDKHLGLQGDYGNIALLLFLYMLQGVPLGLSQTMDLILQEKNIPYEEQGIFSSVSWPYSLKLLWAPLVDALYFNRFGRRKTWLVPTQLLLGAMMVFLGDNVTQMVGVGDESPQVWGLTGFFFTFYLLAATQDVALDGWAVTMLAPRNRGWASTCNAVGQTLGFFLSFTGYIILKSYEIVELAGFMQAWGVVFIIATCAVWAFKHEKIDPSAQSDLSVKEAYKQMWQVLRLSTVQALLLVLFTRGIAFSVTDNLTQRKLINKGMKKEHVASLMVLVTPLSIILPGVISKHTSDRPLSLLGKAFVPRVLLGLASMAIVYFAPDFESLETLPLGFFIAVLFYVVTHAVLSTTMFVAMMAFFAQVADPAIGGTYMTLLNTIANLGNKWPNQVVLFMVDWVTVKECVGASSGLQQCSSADQLKLCVDEAGECVTQVDGFYLLSVVCIAFGLGWYMVFRRRIESLQDASISSWRVVGVDAKRNE